MNESNINAFSRKMIRKKFRKKRRRYKARWRGGGVAPESAELEVHWRPGGATAGMHSCTQERPISEVVQNGSPTLIHLPSHIPYFSLVANKSLKRTVQPFFQR